jgi:hypothetical protein
MCARRDTDGNPIDRLQALRRETEGDREGEGEEAADGEGVDFNEYSGDENDRNADQYRDDDYGDAKGDDADMEAMPTVFGGDELDE